MKSLKILIVEDELLIAKDISIILEKEGYDTFIGVTSVPEAIDKISNNHFDLVIIDIKLSNNTNGVSLGHYLLKEHKIPFIYITSFSDPVSINKVNETRPYGIIIKPFKPEDVRTTVAVVLNNHKHNKIDLLEVEPLEKLDEAPFILRNIVDYINENIEQKIDIHELSERSKWSHQHFIKIFTKYLNQTPYQFILQKKIEKAKVLIASTDIPLSGIAFDLGFQSYSNFYNAFKKETGITPEIYKKQQKIRKYF